MRLCCYVIKADTGFAPNPFWGYCTLAACTPNHKNAQAELGDWMVGHETVARGHKIVYAMRVSEILSFDEYYGDPRFQSKRPRLDRSWREACGDNVYHRNESGEWIKDPSPFHNAPTDQRKDTRYARVYVSDHFYYFGENAVKLPVDYSDLLWGREGYHWVTQPGLVAGFLGWLTSEYKLGIYGDPRDSDACISCDPCAVTSSDGKCKIQPTKRQRLRKGKTTQSSEARGCRSK